VPAHPIDIAAHSRMLEPILGRFGDHLRRMELKAPKIPFVSNRTGAFITDAQATDPEYWVGHLRGTVRFADCVATLAQEPARVYLEVGPGKALSSLAAAHGAVPSQQVLSSLRHPEEKLADDAYFLGLLGRLWALGVKIDWEPIWGEAKRRRVPLPTYAFQRSPYFIEPGAARALPRDEAPLRVDDVAAWGYRPVWRPRLAECEIDVEAELGAAAPQTWLVFVDETGLGARVVARLRAAGQRVVEVRPGDAFARIREDAYVLAPERGREGYDALIRDLVAHGAAPSRIAHFWLVTTRESFRPGGSFFHRNQEQGFFSLLFLAQAIGEENLPKPLHLSVFTSGAAQVRDEAVPYPEKATAMGPVRVIPRELPGVTCAILDLEPPQPSDKLFGGRIGMGLVDPFAGRRSVDAALDKLAGRVLEDLLAEPRGFTGAFRGDKRFEQEFRGLELPEAEARPLARAGPTSSPAASAASGSAWRRRWSAPAPTSSCSPAIPCRPAKPGSGAGAGRSTPSPRASARCSASRRSAVRVMVASADVCNLEQMRTAVAAATSGSARSTASCTPRASSRTARCSPRAPGRSRTSSRRRSTGRRCSTRSSPTARSTGWRSSPRRAR
jgi:acyl transferase domain-containing protein